MITSLRSTSYIYLSKRFNKEGFLGCNTITDSHSKLSTISQLGYLLVWFYGLLRCHHIFLTMENKWGLLYNKHSLYQQIKTIYLELVSCYNLKHTRTVELWNNDPVLWSNWHIPYQPIIVLKSGLILQGVSLLQCLDYILLFYFLCFFSSN